jgi:hypothetical protein
MDENLDKIELNEKTIHNLELSYEIQKCIYSESHLKTLIIKNLNLNKDVPNLNKLIKNSFKLKRLVIKNCNKNMESLQKLFSKISKHSKNLKELEISKNHITQNELIFIIENIINKNNNLSHLDISNNKLSNLDFFQLFENLNNINNLNISHSFDLNKLHKNSRYLDLISDINLTSISMFGDVQHSHEILSAFSKNKNLRHIGMFHS